MKKLLFKMFMPKPEQLAQIAAKAAADFVNSVGREKAIAEFIEKTKSLNKAQVLVTKWLADGKFDEAEVTELQAELTPVAEAVYSKILEKIGG